MGLVIFCVEGGQDCRVIVLDCASFVSGEKPDGISSINPVVWYPYLTSDVTVRNYRMLSDFWAD